MPRTMRGVLLACREVVPAAAPVRLTVRATAKIAASGTASRSARRDMGAFPWLKADCTAADKFGRAWSLEREMRLLRSTLSVGLAAAALAGLAPGVAGAHIGQRQLF